MSIKHIHKSLVSKNEKTFFYINFYINFICNSNEKTKVTFFYVNFFC